MTSHSPTTAMGETEGPADLPVFREHAREKLAKILAPHTRTPGNPPPATTTMAAASSGGPDKLAMAIESALYQALGQKGSPGRPSHEYSQKLRSLLYNLPRNNALLARIRSGLLSPERVVALTPQDLLPAPERAQQEELAQRAYELHRLDHVPPQLADMQQEGGQGSIACPSCSSRHVSSLRRNAVSQEGVIECACRGCGHTWTTDSWAATAGEGGAF